MAHSLGLKLCIEGVETSDDLRQLRGPVLIIYRDIFLESLIRLWNLKKDMSMMKN